MTPESRVRKNPARRLRFRTKLLIAAILGGGTMIAFPAAFAVAVVYVAVALGAIGIMAWTGMIALVSVAVAALLLPILTAIIVFAAVAGVRRLMPTASPLSDVASFNEQQVMAGGTNRSASTDVLQEELDNWETDGGPAEPPRRKHSHASSICSISLSTMPRLFQASTNAGAISTACRYRSTDSSRRPSCWRA